MTYEETWVEDVEVEKYGNHFCWGYGIYYEGYYAEMEQVQRSRNIPYDYLNYDKLDVAMAEIIQKMLINKKSSLDSADKTIPNSSSPIESFRTQEAIEASRSRIKVSNVI